MSLTTITFGGNAHQSYATVAEADIYLAVDPARADVWEGLENATKERNLIAATRRLDELRWAGARAASTQETEWPRSGLKDRDDEDIPSTSVPDEIEQAAILLAAELASNPKVFLTSSAEYDVASQSIGPKSVTYRQRRRRSRLERLIPNETVLALVSQWLARTRTGPSFTGTDGKSEFVPIDRYGRTIGR